MSAFSVFETAVVLGAENEGGEVDVGDLLDVQLVFVGLAQGLGQARRQHVLAGHGFFADQALLRVKETTAEVADQVIINCAAGRALVRRLRRVLLRRGLHLGLLDAEELAAGLPAHKLRHFAEVQDVQSRVKNGREHHRQALQYLLAEFWRHYRLILPVVILVLHLLVPGGGPLGGITLDLAQDGLKGLAHLVLLHYLCLGTYF